ncbi:hypothetical protein U1Q18_033099, partial [Sarracenia purpurea var. burkii]
TVEKARGVAGLVLETRGVKKKLEEKSRESQRSHWKLGTRRQRKATTPNQGVRWLSDDRLVLEKLSDWGGVNRNPVLRLARSKV